MFYSVPGGQFMGRETDIHWHVLVSSEPVLARNTGLLYVFFPVLTEECFVWGGSQEVLEANAGAVPHLQCLSLRRQVHSVLCGTIAKHTERSITPPHIDSMLRPSSAPCHVRDRHLMSFQALARFGLSLWTSWWTLLINLQSIWILFLYTG